MNESFAQSPSTRTWRQIPQALKPRSMTVRGRRRAFSVTARTGVAITISVGLVVGAIALVSTWDDNPVGLAATSAVQPVTRIELKTDGTLETDWVARTLALPAGSALNDIDLAKLRSRLLATGRVESANITRVLPSTLKVALTERLPVVRIRTEDDGDLYVGRDGIVFPSAGDSDNANFDRLPWLGGIRLARSGAGFTPIPGMKAVAELLAMGRNETPTIYSSWVSVDLSRLDDGEIGVRSKAINRIVFSTASDFYLQLARLDYLRDHAPGVLKTVNLGLGSGVVMTFDHDL